MVQKTFKEFTFVNEVVSDEQAYKEHLKRLLKIAKDIKAMAKKGKRVDSKIALRNSQEVIDKIETRLKKK